MTRMTTTEGFLAMAQDSKLRNRTPSEFLLARLDPDGLHIVAHSFLHKVYVPSSQRKKGGASVSGTIHDKGEKSRREHAEEGGGVEMRTVWFVKVLDSKKPETVIMDCATRTWEMSTMDVEEYDKFHDLVAQGENPTPPEGWRLEEN